MALLRPGTPITASDSVDPHSWASHRINRGRERGRRLALVHLAGNKYSRPGTRLS